jgi:hypothetical protein
MPSLDIFTQDAFSLTSLTKAINEAPFLPSRLSELGLFQESGVPTTTIFVEKLGMALSLVEAGERGSPAKSVGADRRNAIPFKLIHLPQRATILADEVQNVRAFGSQSDVELVTDVVTRRLTKMRRNLDATIEYQRMGALKGQILDADGSTVLEDLFDRFGLSQNTFDMALSDATKNTRAKCLQVKRSVELELGMYTYTGLRALCSPSFFDALVSKDDVQKAYTYFQGNEMLRNDPRGGFLFGDIVWENYRGKVGAIDFIPDGTALLIPEGVTDLFITNYGPADYADTVNTIGLPYYARQQLMDFNKGVEIEAQSNPISLCTRPRTVVKLTA